MSRGLAMAFHNGLFILQLVPLLAVFVLWLHGLAPPPRTLLSFAIALVVTTQLILLPSEAYRRDPAARLFADSHGPARYRY